VRTTLDIDDDLIAAAKELARRERSTAGQVISRLLRQSLTGTAPAPKRKASARIAGGFRPFPARDAVVSNNEQVDRLRDAEGV
jgi:hypothetical protein